MKQILVLLTLTYSFYFIISLIFIIFILLELYVFDYTKQIVTFLLKRNILSYLGKNWERNKRKKKELKGCEWEKLVEVKLTFALKDTKKRGSALCSPCSLLPTSDLAFSLSRVWGGDGVRPVVSDHGFVGEGKTL